MRRMSAVVLASVLGVALPAWAAEELRTYLAQNLGKITMVVPMEWAVVQRHEAESGNTVFRLLPPRAGQFDLEITVNDMARLKMEAYAGAALEHYLQTQLAEAASGSVEGSVTTKHFGVRREPAFYARLTDKAPKPGEFLLYTHGARQQGRKMVLFNLYSNDADAALLRKTLDVVASVTFEP